MRKIEKNHTFEKSEDLGVSSIRAIKLKTTIWKYNDNFLTFILTKRFLNQIKICSLLVELKGLMMIPTKRFLNQIKICSLLVELEFLINKINFYFLVFVFVTNILM